MKWKPVSSAIREFCRQCTDGSHKAIRECLASRPQGDGCEIRVFRQRGQRRGGLKAVRRECLRCQGTVNRSRPSKDAVKGVRECSTRNCSFWAYRFGIRPLTAHRRGLDVRRICENPESERLKEGGCHGD